MLRRCGVAAVSRRRGCAALVQHSRSLRTIVPPRPEVTTLVYLDHKGRVVSGGRETDVSLVRLRDNTFHMQRLLSTGEVIRWHVPGLDFLKHSSNFESYSVGDIDHYGGVSMPVLEYGAEASSEWCFIETVSQLCACTPTSKVTRRQRREEHRVAYAHWREVPREVTERIFFVTLAALFVVAWVCIRWHYSVRNNKSFWDSTVYEADYDYSSNRNVDDYGKMTPVQRALRCRDEHPELTDDVPDSLMLSPGQRRLARSRAELQEVDTTDPHFHSELWWRIVHLYFYGHWPKPLAA